MESAINLDSAQNRIVGVTMDDASLSTNPLASASSQLFVGGLGIVENSQHYQFNLLRPAFEPDPQPPPDPPDVTP